MRTWTPAHVEGWLREFALNRGGLNTDAFTALTIKFQRTTRLPVDGQTYSPPSAWGQLPLRSVDDFAETAPAAWMRKGGVIMPLARSEALCIWFSSRYRFAAKIGAGKLNALSGEPWSSDLQRQPQNYLVAPGPPWSENDEVLRRYVALPPGTDDAVNGLRADRADAGGIQFQVVPLRAESYYDEEGGFFLPRTIQRFFTNLIFAPMISAQIAETHRRHESWMEKFEAQQAEEPVPEVTALQDIEEDPYQFAEWEQAQTVRCCVHLCDSSVWR